jgi:hypothetical protein
LNAEEDREEAVKPSQLEMSQSIPLSFELVARAVSAQSWTNSLCCSACQVPLNLHQPDEEQPSQLLGTCEGCSRWFFLVESELEWEGMLLFELPSADTIRRMFAVPLSVH